MSVGAHAATSNRPVTPSAGPSARRWGERLGLPGWLYAAPTAAVVGVLFILPVLLAIWMSVSDWPLIGKHEINFPANYTRIPSDSLFIQGIGFTVLYTVLITVLLIVVAMVLALIVEQPRRAVGLLRTAYFVPAVVGLTSSALLFYGLYAPSIGPLNPALQAIGVIDTPIDWLGTPFNALASTLIMMTWRFAGFYMLILLTGLHAIPREIYEAARMDGASATGVFRYVTLPLLRPSLALCFVLIITGGLLAFEQFYVLTSGGPDNSTVTMVMAMFRQAFSHFDLGRAAAIAVVMLIALVAVNSVQLSIIRRQNP